jgi:hypothetical protein
MGPPKKVEGRTHQGRPSTNAISHRQEADTAEPSSTVVCFESIAVQLRRRREASYRLPPLPSGRRDPWGASR